MIVDVKGVQVDLALALPLKVRDWKALGRVGVSPETLRDAEKLTIEVSSVFIAHICAKANAAVTQEMIDDLTIEELYALMIKIGEVRSGIDRPTSTSSISSPASTDGPVLT